MMSLSGVWTYFGAMAIFFFMMGLPIAAMIMGGLWVAILVGVFGYGGYTAVKSRRDDIKAFQASAEKARNAPVHDPEFGIFHGYVCPTWDQNRIERELGGTDFMLCNYEKCPACYPLGKCVEAGCDLAAITEGDHGDRLCNGHDMARVAAHAKERKSLERPKNAKFFESSQKREKAARQQAEWMMQSIEAANKRGEEKRAAIYDADDWEIRDDSGKLLATYNGTQADAEAYAKELATSPWVIIDGTRFIRHKDVPAFAHGRKYIPFEPGQHVEIHWEWIDPDTGKTMALKQLVFDMEPGGKPDWVKSVKIGDYNKPVKDEFKRRRPRRESGINLNVPAAYRRKTYDKGYG